MKKKTFTRGDFVEVDRNGSWTLATYVEERPPGDPGGQVSHVVRVRGERMGHSINRGLARPLCAGQAGASPSPHAASREFSFSPRRIREASAPRLAANLLRTAERLLVEEGAPMPRLSAARRLGVDLRGPAWALAVRACV